MRSLIVIAPARVGDTVLAQSLFKVLTAEAHGCAIEVLAPGRTLTLLVRMPEVRTAIEIPPGRGVRNAGNYHSLAAGLREKHYEQAIVLSNSLESALLPIQARIPWRTGYGGVCGSGY